MYLFVLIELVSLVCGVKEKLSDSYLPPIIQVLTHAGENLDILPYKDVEYYNYSAIITAITEEKQSEYIEDDLNDDKMVLTKLRNVLAAEALTNNLNRYNGFTQELEKNLKKNHKSAKEQLEELLVLMIQKGHTRWKQGKRLSNHVIAQISKDETQMSKLLSSVHPLIYY